MARRNQYQDLLGIRQESTVPPLDRPLVSWVQRVLLVVLLATAFAYVEAAVVVDLRAIYDPIRISLYPDLPPESLLPLITLEQLHEVDPSYVRQRFIELGRELATMIMLVAMAALAVRRRGEWIAMFMISFGVWDIGYYVALKTMIDFPASLLTWDILFLLPVPWLGPVLAPVIVSVTMIGAGLAVLVEIGRGRRLRARWFHWTAIVLGGLIIIASFCQDYDHTLAGEMPGRFNWVLFGAGEILGLLAFIHAVVQGRKAGYAQMP